MCGIVGMLSRRGTVSAGTSDLALAIPSRCRSSSISLSNTRLSPLIHDHINLLGRYSFAMPDIVARGGLLPLRDPTDQNT